MSRLQRGNESKLYKPEGLIIGHCADKRFEELAKHLEERGHKLVPVDFSRPIEGHYDVLIHKITRTIGQRKTNSSSARQVRVLENFIHSHPSCLVLDHPSAVELTTDRVALDAALEKLELSDNSGSMHYPRSLVLENGQQCESFRWPAVAKPMNADGSPESHDMALVYNPAGLRNLQRLGKKIVLQEFINHDAVLHKIYCLGDHVFMGVRPSLPNVDLKHPHKECDFFGRISQNEDASCFARVAPSMHLVRMLCAELRKRLGLSLFGVDVITRSGTNEHYVIDVNYFPSYAGMPHTPATFASFIEKEVEKLNTKVHVR